MELESRQGQEIFLLSRHVQIVSGAHAISYLVGTRAFSQGCYCLNAVDYFLLRLLTPPPPPDSLQGRILDSLNAFR